MDKKYVALKDDGGYDPCYATGSLAEILFEIESNSRDVSDFAFFELGNKIEVVLEKKLVLVVKE